MKYRIWWIPQVPGTPFHHDVDSPLQAKTMLHVLAMYDLFLLEHNHRVDFSNVGGLQYFDEQENEWFDWEDENGYSVDDDEAILT